MFERMGVKDIELLKARNYRPDYERIPKQTGIVYLITNDCGLYYIGKHIVKAHLDPWITHDEYYGSGGKLKRAMIVIRTGWNPRETIWVGKTTNENPGRDAYEEETRLINLAKNDLNCLNHHWDVLRWV